MFTRFVFAILAILFFTQPVLAEQKEKDCSKAASDNGRSHIILFVNGILNTKPQAECSLESLRKLVDPEAAKSDFELLYNPSKTGTQGLIEDTSELRSQAKISDRAHDIAQNDYTIQLNGASSRDNYVLGKLYAETIKNEGYSGEIEKEVYVRTNELYGYLRDRVAEGKSITVVAHSQGNFYIEAAIAIMRYKEEYDMIAKINVISVAISIKHYTKLCLFLIKERSRSQLATHSDNIPKVL